MENLLALNGKLACGKTTVSEKLTKEYEFQIISIGTTIKKAATLLIENKADFKNYLLEVLKEKSVTHSLYEEITTEYDKRFKNATWKKDKDGHYIKNQNYRDLTQFVAFTLREELGEDIWVKFLANDALKLSKEGKRVICDDLRYPSEKEIFENFGFKTIRFDISKDEQKNRIQSRGDGDISDETLNHPSETALDTAVFDLRFDTSDLTKEEMFEVVVEYIFKEKGNFK